MGCPKPPLKHPQKGVILGSFMYPVLNRFILRFRPFWVKTGYTLWVPPGNRGVQGWSLGVSKVTMLQRYMVVTRVIVVIVVVRVCNNIDTRCYYHYYSITYYHLGCTCVYTCGPFSTPHPRGYLKQAQTPIGTEHSEHVHDPWVRGGRWCIRGADHGATYNQDHPSYSEYPHIRCLMQHITATMSIQSHIMGAK